MTIYLFCMAVLHLTHWQALTMCREAYDIVKNRQQAYTQLCLVRLLYLQPLALVDLATHLVKSIPTCDGERFVVP